MEKMKPDTGGAAELPLRRYSTASNVALSTASALLREGNLAEAAYVACKAADLAEMERLEASPEAREALAKLMARCRA